MYTIKIRSDDITSEEYEYEKNKSECTFKPMLMTKIKLQSPSKRDTSVEKIKRILSISINEPECESNLEKRANIAGGIQSITNLKLEKTQGKNTHI